MLVVNSFDLWQKDTFFSAAEEVQQSADIMESAYRTWIRERREGTTPECLDELNRELQMALGTAKWQLEEFERAVRLSYRNPADEITMTRHRQFVSVIEDQISHVEAALKESFNMDRKQPLQWVNLDEKERDDFALFLSGTPETSQSSMEESSKLRAFMTGYPQDKNNRIKDYDLNVKVGAKEDFLNQPSGVNDVSTRNTDPIPVIELEAKGTVRTRTNVDCQADERVSTRRTWSSQDMSKLQIVIECKDKQMNPLDIETTSKDKRSKTAIWSPKYKDHPQGKQGMISLFLCRRINWTNRIFGRIAGSQRQLHNTPMHPFGFSIRFMLVLMLTIFLVVPFVFIQLRSK